MIGYRLKSVFCKKFRTWRRCCSLLPALLFLTGCMATLPRTGLPSAGTYRVNTGISYRWADRSFLLHVPPGYAPNAPLPLVLVLHGAFSTGEQTEAETGFSALADTERFLVAYPEGIGLFGLLQHWNAGHCCGKAADDGVDDVEYLTRVIVRVREALAVDPSRIYIAGMSNGGMMTYRFAAERTDQVAAAAVVSGAIGSTEEPGRVPWRLPLPTRPLPIIAFHGLADEHVPPFGGISPLGRGPRSYLSVNDAMEFWRHADGCTAATTTTSSSGAVTRYISRDCRDGSAVEYSLLLGWGHQWPAPSKANQLQSDHPLHGFDATREIWEFFKRFRRGGVSQSEVKADRVLWR